MPSGREAEDLPRAWASTEEAHEPDGHHHHGRPLGRDRPVHHFAVADGCGRRAQYRDARSVCPLASRQTPSHGPHQETRHRRDHADMQAADGEQVDGTRPTEKIGHVGGYFRSVTEPRALSNPGWFSPLGKAAGSGWTSSGVQIFIRTQGARARRACAFWGHSPGKRPGAVCGSSRPAMRVPTGGGFGHRRVQRCPSGVRRRAAFPVTDCTSPVVQERS